MSFKRHNRIVTVLSSIVISLMVTQNCLSEDIQWLEAEEFHGNSKILKDTKLSGNACVEGWTWYNIVSGAPFPQDGKSYHVWVRASSTTPAWWYLWDSANKKVVGWFKTSTTGQWEWVDLGNFNSANLNGRFWDIYLRKPQDENIPTAQGRLDALVIAEATSKAELEALTQSRLASASGSPKDMNSRMTNVLFGARRMADCPFTTNSPVIDGTLDEKCWHDAAKLSDFKLMYKNGLASQKTIGYVCADKTNLYIAAELMEDQIRFLRKLKTIRNDDIWTDDCLELFIDPGLSQKDYYHFVVNPRGARQDNLMNKNDRAGATENANLDWKAAVSIANDKWIVEMAIPWTLISTSTPKSGDIWGFNIAREERPSQELSYWTSTGINFHSPDAFGLLSFGRKQLHLEGISIAGKKDAISLLLTSGTQINLKVSAIIYKGSAEIKRIEKLITLVPQKRDVVILGLPTLEAAKYTLSLDIGDNSQSIYKIKLPFRTYSDGMISVAWPAEERDEKLYIAANTVQHCFFVLANHSGQKIVNSELVVSVPQGVEILDPTGSFSKAYYPVTRYQTCNEDRNADHYMRYTLNLGRALVPQRIETIPFYQSVLLFFKITSPALKSHSSLPVYYHLESEGQVEAEHTMNLIVLPPIIARTPKKIQIHNWLWTYNPNPKTWPEYIKTLRCVGFNAVDPDAAGGRPEYITPLRRAKFRIIQNFWWFWWNREYLSTNPDDAAVDYDGKSLEKLCPTLLLRNTELLKSSIVEYLDYITAGQADGFVWDLESPSPWTACFCPKCIGAFKKYASLPADEKLTPKLLRTKYPRQWVDFACHQSSMLCRNIRKLIKQRNNDATFSVYSGNPSFATMEQYRMNWEEACKYLDAAYLTYYSASSAHLDRIFSDGLKNFIKILHASAGNNPIKVIATLTSGYGRNQPIQPSVQLNRIQVLRSIASGADGVSFWWWGPMDGLYYSKLAEAFTLISDLESFFVNGIPVAAVKCEPDVSNGASIESRLFDNCTMTIIFNHDPKAQKQFSISFKSVMKNCVGYTYPQMVKFNPNQQQTIVIDPLDVAVYIVGPETELRTILPLGSK